MEAEMVPSLSPLLQGADQWNEVLLLLPLLVALEAVLSADNAIALAAISRRLHDPARQRQALNLGLIMALVLRMALILAARWVLDAWPLQLAASVYLLWLCGRHLLGRDEVTDEEAPDQTTLQHGAAPRSGGVPAAVAPGAAPLSAPLSAAALVDPAAAGQPAGHDSSGVAPPPPGHQHAHPGPTLASIALTLALTDLAFSLDSVAAAVAVTDRLALVMAGGLLGVLALRLTAGLFVRWLELFSRLETAGYLAVGLVGIRLMLRLLLPDLEVPEWLLLLLVSGLFLWGFSQRNPAVDPAAEPAVGASAQPLPAEATAADAPGERLPPAAPGAATSPAVLPATAGKRPRLPERPQP